MTPHLINFPKIGSRDIGYLSFAEKLPFKINRVYWTYHTPSDVARGGHSHKELEQVLLALSGTITIYTENLNGESNRFILSNQSQGLYLPQQTWRDIKYSHDAIQLCLASLEYDEKDYIRSYNQFKNAI